MRAHVLDTQTGEIKVKDGIRSWEWACNNWSCDCNRELLFGHDTNDGICIGSHRYLVIGAEMNSPDDYGYSLYELNSEYPDGLLKKHGIRKDNIVDYFTHIDGELVGFGKYSELL